ncbi:hypothetical protein EMM73_17605 [Rheinheimera sediminis]|uniref:hypothetical protein n=1 Tax=Rheinheimera sp. YQF-1 TaxID=2499626 RepID=UPI000FDC63D5|nr:hypothetical protein [Rheinheimera sp. YQF-1]RVT44086.1 hypothetical protein EMM73_17605 [Rheinheimera sp. YQF-1]
MAKQLKKASLLSEAERQKLLKKAGNKKPLTQAQTSAATRPPATVSSRVENRSSSEEHTESPIGSNTKIWWSTAVLFFIILLLTPKPALLEYQSAGLTTQSIYMPGWFGKPGIILDTNQRAILAEEEQSLYLCFESKTNEQCAKYQLRKQQGLVSAVLFWLSSL